MSIDKEKIKKRLLRLARVAKTGDVGVLGEISDLDEKIDVVDTKITTNTDAIGGKLDTIIKDVVTPVNQVVTFKDTNIATIRGKDGKNGADGKDGKRGEKGDKGERGENGKDGKDGTNGKDGADGLSGLDGKDGIDGVNGKDGSPDTAQQITEKLNTLEDTIEPKTIKGSKSLGNLDRAISILDQRTQFLINKPSGSSSNYTLPTASASTLGGVKIGARLTMTGDTLSADVQAGGSGDFVGSASSTDNAILRFDGTTGKLGQNSLVTIDDSNNGIFPATIGSELAPALTAGNWTVGSGWESPIVGPGLIKNADGTGTQTPSAATEIVAGTTYKVVITTSAWTVGSFTYTLGGVTGTTVSTATTTTNYITALTTGNLIITPTNTSRGTVSVISFKELTNATGDLEVDGNLVVQSPSTFNSNITVPRGSASLPSVSSFNASSSGLYFPSSVAVGITTNGAQRVQFDLTGATVTGKGIFSGTVTSGLGTVSIPTYSFTGHTDSGLYWDTGLNYIAVSVGGVLNAWFGANNIFQIFNAGGFQAALDPTALTAERIFAFPNVAGTMVVASAVNSVSPTAPNRTLTINIGGTTYYIAAKTTND